MKNTSHMNQPIDLNIYEALPGSGHIRRQYQYTGNGCNMPIELREHLGDGVYSCDCVFAFNVLHAPQCVQIPSPYVTPKA